MNVYCVNGWYLLKSITYPLNECVLCKWMVYELKCCCCCCYSITQLCSVCWDPMDCSMSGFPVLHHLPELAKTHIHRSVITSNDLILCRPRLLLPSIFPSIRVFSNESVLHIRRPKYWSFSFSTSLSNAYSVLISFRMDCLDLLAVQGTLKILLQHHSSKASILRCSAFSIVQLDVCSCHLLFDHFQCTLIHGPDIPGSSAILLFTASNLASKAIPIHNWVLFLLWLHPFILSGVISPLISSSILGTYWPREFIFQCPIFLPFHTVHGVLKARILKWFAIPFSSGPHSVRPLHHDPSVLGGPTGHGLVSLS